MLTLKTLEIERNKKLLTIKEEGVKYVVIINVIKLWSFTILTQLKRILASQKKCLGVLIESNQN